MEITAYFCGALLLLLWYRVCARQSVDKTQVQLRQNIILVEPSIYILKLIRRLEYIWHGPEILRQAQVGLCFTPDQQRRG
jgi:hypothetical protein